MLITATKNKTLDLPEQLRKFAYGYFPSEELPLTLGKTYLVSAIQVNKYGEFYLIIPDDREEYSEPWWYPSALFKIIDGYTPEDWTSNSHDDIKMTGFKEVVEDSHGKFYNDLLDGEKYAKEIFFKYYNKYAEHHGIDIHKHR